MESSPPSASDDGNLKTYDGISRSLTFTKQSSNIQPSMNYDVTQSGSVGRVSNSGTSDGYSTEFDSISKRLDSNSSQKIYENSDFGADEYSASFTACSSDTYLTDSYTSEFSEDFSTHTSSYSHQRLPDSTPDKFSGYSMEYDSETVSDDNRSGVQSSRSYSTTPAQAEHHSKSEDHMTDFKLHSQNYPSESEPHSQLSRTDSESQTQGNTSDSRSRTQGYSSDSRSRTQDYSSDSRSRTQDYSSDSRSRTQDYSSDSRSRTQDYSSDSRSRTQDYSSDLRSRTQDYSSDLRSRTQDYSSDFEDSVQSDVGKRTTFNQQDLERQLLYVNRARKNLQQSEADISQSESTWKAELVRERDARLTAEARRFIASSLANVKQETNINLEQCKENDNKHFTNLNSSQNYQPLPRDHCFYSRVERLKLENVLTGMRQKSEELSAEIKGHRNATRNGLPSDAIRKYVLPRKLRLERNAFALKLDNHEAKMNSIAMIGSLARDLPRPSDNPEVIWSQLMNTAKRRVPSDDGRASFDLTQMNNE